MHLWMVMVAALACGCATELDVAEPEAEPAAKTRPSGLLQPHADQPIGEIPEPVVSTDPCDCEDDPECLDEWAESALACDVCVVLLCDDEWHPHVCHFC